MIVVISSMGQNEPVFVAHASRFEYQEYNSQLTRLLVL